MRLLGIGVGSLPGEAAAVGVDYATRGRRADEAIDALRLLWAGDEHGVSFDGEFYSFAGACSFPKPSQPLPIHIGGSSPAAARRAGLRGDGYFPGGRRRRLRHPRPPRRRGDRRAAPAVGGRRERRELRRRVLLLRQRVQLPQAQSAAPDPQDRKSVV